jgi:LPXTG-site transpeptidase (sortase) family protein
MKKLFILLIIFTVVIGLGFLQTLHIVASASSRIRRNASGIIRKSDSAVVQAAAIVPDIPVTLTIPSVSLISQIVPVTLTSAKIVDTPSSGVGWYKDGAVPGATGSAVLDGHFINMDLSTGVFHELYRMKTGDDIRITDRLGQQFHFRVTSVQTVPVVNFPIVQVYGSAGGPMLNLVTCAGFYDLTRKDYSERTIVYSQFVN